jgi:hypothetical protein
LSENPTPGAIAYAAYWQTHYTLRHPTHSKALIGWTKLMPKTQQCWEAAAAAVLAQYTPQEDTP